MRVLPNVCTAVGTFYWPVSTDTEYAPDANQQLERDVTTEGGYRERGTPRPFHSALQQTKVELKRLRVHDANRVKVPMVRVQKIVQVRLDDGARDFQHG